MAISAGRGWRRLNCRPTGPQAEADSYRWLRDVKDQPSQRFRFRTIDATKGRPLATTPDGKCFCAAFDRGRGRLIYLAVPYGMGIDRRAMPVLPRLMAHLTRGLMPVEVSGEVEWMVNRTAAGWLITLLNPAGQSKPQQGHHADRFPREPPGDDPRPCADPIGARSAPADRSTIGETECSAVRGGGRGSAHYRIKVRSSNPRFYGTICMTRWNGSGTME